MDERRAQIGDTSVFWLEAGDAPIVYLHGVPTDADDWLPFLERTGGVAPDLPGFGRSDKPPHFPYGIDGYDRFVEAFLDEAGLERVSLVVHDWGAVGLATAGRLPERIDRLVVMDAVPFVPGYRWHRVARLWRTPLIGEMAMGFTFKFGMRRALRDVTVTEGQPSDEWIDRVWSRFDHGTQRAILKLYRSAPSHVLAKAGERLGEIGRPALVVWGDHEPYLPARFGEAYAEALGGRFLLMERAGHWPWLDRPDLVDEVARFLAGEGDRR